MRFFLNSFLIIFLFSQSGFAQIGGQHVFNYLELTPSAKINATGGANVSNYLDDPTAALHNPALSSDMMDSHFSASIVNYIADVSYTSAAYSMKLKNIGNLNAGLQYFSYGKFTEADIYGNQTGEFSAGNLALTAGLSRDFGKTRFGANIKFTSSNIANYNSLGIGMDFGGAYIDTAIGLTIGGALRNIGSQLTTYTENSEKEKMPFSIELGVTKRIEHTPFRVSATFTNLQTPNLIYTDPDQEPEYDLSGNEIPVKKRTGDKIFSHVALGLDVLLGKVIEIRAGYNHYRRIELKIEERSGLAGLTLGFGLKIKQFQLDYAFAQYHLTGASHHFSISTPLNRFWKK